MFVNQALDSLTHITNHVFSKHYISLKSQILLPIYKGQLFKTRMSLKFITWNHYDERESGSISMYLVLFSYIEDISSIYSFITINYMGIKECSGFISFPYYHNI